MADITKEIEAAARGDAIAWVRGNPLLSDPNRAEDNYVCREAKKTHEVMVEIQRQDRERAIKEKTAEIVSATMKRLRIEEQNARENFAKILQVLVPTVDNETVDWSYRFIDPETNAKSPTMKSLLKNMCLDVRQAETEAELIKRFEGLRIKHRFDRREVDRVEWQKNAVFDQEAILKRNCGSCKLASE